MENDNTLAKMIMEAMRSVFPYDNTNVKTRGRKKPKNPKTKVKSSINRDMKEKKEKKVRKIAAKSRRINRR